jgi:membrane protease YdiL (CAAX protease family)
MTDASKQPERVLELPAEAGAAPPSGDRFAADLRGFGPLGILAILVILLTGNVILSNMVVLPIGAALALLWTWLSRTPWREIGYVRPRSWIGALAAGVAFGTAFKFLMKVIVMPLFGADPINHAYHFLAGNRAMLPTAVWGMFIAGFGEETVFRGYMFERLGKLFGPGVGAKTSIVLLTAVWFGLSHYYIQGLAGVEQAAIVGLVFGAIFAATGRIFMLMCAHTAFDLTALAIIYWNLESDVAHLVFK